MSITAFSEQQELLKAKLQNAKRFSGECFNYLKIVQHAVTYSRNGDSSKLLRNPWGRNTRLVRLYYRLRARRDKRSRPAPLLTSILVLENGRFVTDAAGNIHSAHYSAIGKALPRSVQTTLLTRPDSPLKHCDYVLGDLLKEVSPFPLSDSGQALMADLNRVIRRLRRSGDFSAEEMKYIESAAHVFFEQFIGFDALIRNRGVEVCLFDNHYHNEGMIAALKLNGVRCIEVQHGLIATSDLYYAYPEYVKEVRDRALFPDLLLLFGQYWKDVLLQGHEHAAEDLVVVGDYTASSGDIQQLSKEKGKLILITAQKNNAVAFVPYTRKLMALLREKHPSWKLAIKLHPLEKEVEAYHTLKADGVEILGNESNLMQALAASRIHISINSTTFFDAIGLDTLNLSLQDYGVSADYAREIVEAGVALPLREDEDPVALLEQSNIEETSFGNRDYYYRPFDPEILRAAIALHPSEQTDE